MKPEAGQTWVNEKFGDKVYFIGRCANGIMVFQVEGNEIEHGDLDWSGWRLMQPEDTACDECGGSGEIDSGGCTPWMAPINVPCGKCAQPEPQPAEDPDEWVILDPVKYADHVPRVGIDQFENAGKTDEWITQTNIHHTLPIGPFFEAVGIKHRCRRRDLPKVEQKKTTDDFGMYLESVIAKDPQLKAEVDAAEAEMAEIDARLNEPQPQKTRVSDEALELITHLRDQMDALSKRVSDCEKQLMMAKAFGVQQ